MGKERKTRSANGAARRFARPRWESASVNADGIRRVQAASTIGPATYPPPPRTTFGRRRARISRHASGARPASASARRRARLGSRGNPAIENGSNWYPASGTSCASTRSGDPAKVTRTPRLASASATASDGSTWPPVPPAAITHASSPFDCIRAPDVKENPRRAESCDQTRASVGDERQRDARERRDREHGREVDRRLAADQHREPGGEQLAERILAVERSPEAGPSERGVGGDHPSRAEEPELLADGREDHVRVRLGEIEDLDDAVADADAQRPARAQPDHRLDDLEACPLRIVPGIEEAEQARASVWLEPDREHAERGDDREGAHEQAARQAGHDQDPAEHHHDRDRRTEIGLDEDEHAREPGDEPERLAQILQ